MSWQEFVLMNAVAVARLFIRNPQHQAEVQHYIDELAELLDQIRTPKTP